jgi:membrane protein DedA with SNARE-associated domain
VDGITRWATDVMASLGYLGLGLLVALEMVAPPLPSEVILPLAGFLCGRGEMAVFLAIAAATAGSVLGAFVLYELGRRVGEPRVRAFLRSKGRYLLLDEHDLERSQRWFARRGDLAVLLGRLIPGVRCFISIPAGLQRMHLGRFLVLTAVGSTVWNALLILLGYLVGARWRAISGAGTLVGNGVLALLALVLALLIARRLRERRTAV